EWNDASPRLGVKLSRSRFELLLGAGDDGHVRAFPSQLAGDGFADAQAAARHDRALVPKPKIHREPPRSEMQSRDRDSIPAAAPSATRGSPGQCFSVSDR